MLVFLLNQSQIFKRSFEMKRIIFIIGLSLLIATFAFAQNKSTITTTGNDNTASATQTGSNEASIEQIANNSTATQLQDGSGNKADLDQKGGWPAGSTVLNEIGYQEQTGNNNQATLWQLADGGSGGNNGNQYQEGNGNKVIAWQHTVNGVVDQDQIGNNNEAHAYQTGFNGYIKQNQNGTANIAAVDEQGGGGWVVGNKAEQTQTGNWNKSEISQYGTGGAKSGQGNEAYITQIGHDNWAGEGLFNNSMWGIYQKGNYNVATVNQNDNVNKSQVFQSGDLNTSTVTQNGGTGLFGDYGMYINQSTVTQTGNNNNCNVTQTYQ